MAGIRVRNVPKNAKEKHLKIHFSKPEHGGGRIQKIYYPLFNNDAVIIYEDTKVLDRVLKTEHHVGTYAVDVQALPEHMVFSTMDAKLDDEASVIVQVTRALRDEMEYAEGIRLVEEKDKTFRLQGNWFQLEWAWHYIDCFMQQQEVIQHEISQQPQRYARQPMEVEQSEEDFTSAAFHHQTPTSVTEVNTNLRKNIAERAQQEDGARQKRRELQSEEIVESLSYREPGERAQQEDGARQKRRELQNEEIVKLLSYREPGKESQFYDYRDPKSHDIDDTDDDDERPRPRPSSLDNMGALKANISSTYDNKYNHGNYSSKGSHQDSDEELTGSGHRIPLDSMQSTINPEEGHRRSKDENLTFREFSGLHSMSQYSPERNLGKSLKNENRRSDAAHHESKTSAELLSTLSSSQSRNVSLSHGSKEGLGKSGKRSVDAVDHSLGLNKPRLPARSMDIPDHYTEDQLCHSFDIRGVTVTIYFGNLVKEETDAIVNAANEQLEHYGGIAYAILKARGREMEQECKSFVRNYGNLQTSEVTHTSGGGEIKSSNIIHAAGPMWLSDRWKDKFRFQLTNTFLNCLEYADKKLWIRSIALPAISSGVYGAPLDTCVRCFLDAVLIFTHQQGENHRLTDIRLVNNDAESTVTSIVLVQTLLDQGIGTLTADAEDFMAKHGDEDREMNLPRGRPEGVANFSKTYTKQSFPGSGNSSVDPSPSDDKWALSRRRSSSLSRVTDRKTQGGEVRKYDPEKNKFITESKTKEVGGTAGSSFVEKHRERSGSMNTKPKKGANSSLRNTISGISGAKMTESLSPSSKQPSFGDGTRRSAPKIKSALFTSDRLKIKSPTSSPKRSEHFGLRTSDDYGAFLHAGKTKTHHRLQTDTSEDDEDYGLRSLPADMHKHTSTYREKFLQSSVTKPEVCAICLDDVQDPKQLSKCKHKFCRACIERHFKSSKPTCPTCGALYGKVVGDQPRSGRMTHVTDRNKSLPGYEHEDGMIIITYTFPDGIQESCHPQPGRSYKGISRKAFLPNCVEGREVLRLLKKAFDARLVFTIGESKTRGEKDVLTWNDIHHKTSVGGGPTRFGYPDSRYLQRVKEELAVKGITSDK